MSLPLTAYRDQHRRLLDLVVILEHHIAQRDLEHRASVVRHAMDTLWSHLDQHLQAEESTLYVMPLRDDPQSRGAVDRLAAEVGGLRESFQAYMRSWSMHAIRTRSQDFVDASQVLFTLLRNRIAREEQVLYALVDRSQPNALAADPGVALAEPLVLVVDDNDGDYILLTEAWKETHARCRLEHQRTADGVLSRCEDTLPDLLVVDINLPVMNGVELVRCLRQRPEYQLRPIVLCSSSDASREEARARDAGATGFFPKPVTFEEYGPFVHTMIDLIAYYRDARQRAEGGVGRE